MRPNVVMKNTSKTKCVIFSYFIDYNWTNYFEKKKSKFVLKIFFHPKSYTITSYLVRLSALIYILYSSKKTASTIQISIKDLNRIYGLMPSLVE